MRDVVISAMSDKPDETIWAVTFANGETKTGPINTVSEGIYALTSGPAAYYFDAATVIFMRPG